MSFRAAVEAHHQSFAFYVVAAVFRFFQLVLALTVCGLYGVDLNNARVQGKYADAKWVYAEVVGGISAVTALVYLIPWIKTYMLFAWDSVVFILYTALFGIFGRMWIGHEPDAFDPAQTRIKNSVWVDLVNMLLWLVTAIYGLCIYFAFRESRSLYTGRAKV